MSEFKISVFYVVATILVLLSMTLFVNGTVGAETFEGARESTSSLLAGLLLRDGGHTGGTLYDIFCYDHNEYFGLRF